MKPRTSNGVRLFMYHAENSMERSAFVSVPPISVPVGIRDHKLSELIPSFIRHAQYELSMSAETAHKYRESLGWVIRHLGDLDVKSIDLGYVTILKQKIIARGVGESRVASITYALKSFLRYCSEALEIPVLDYKKIKSPRRHRREVVFLTNEEVQQFVDSIKFENGWGGKVRKRCIRVDGLRFRTLVEVLLGTGMRISEALSLNRDQIDFEKAEAKIIGKGSKERTIFFSQRSLDWIKFYLEHRADKEAPLFLTKGLRRWHRADVDKIFRGYVKRSGLTKQISPHTLRHTMATNLLFNGCPIGHIKEILGHERLETTCRYYLGLDKSKAKEAHKQFLNFQ